MELEDIKVITRNKEEAHEEVKSLHKSLNSFIKYNFASIFTNPILSQNFIEIQFDFDLELLNVENVLKILDFFVERAFVLRVVSAKSNELAFYWRVQGTKQVLTFECEANEKLREFIAEFLIKQNMKEAWGTLPGVNFDDHQLINQIDLYLIGDERGFNLLFLASEAENTQVVQSLLEEGMNVSCLVDGKIPADIAYEKKHLDALLCLLKANSRFPRDFEAREEINDCNSMLQISLNLRTAVLKENCDIIKEILNSNKNLRYFYDTNNQSILTFALVNKKFEMYKFLMSFNLSFGSREDFEEIAELLDHKEERKLRNIHQQGSLKIVDKHLMILMANSFVAHDNFDTCDKFNHIHQAYKYLNNISIASPILKAVAARRDFEIHFDFNRDNVTYLHASQTAANGLFYLSGRILISAKGLLDPECRNEVYGVIIHELTHFAMSLVYKNRAKPYFPGSSEATEIFENINAFCKSRMEFEPLIQSVYDDYEDEAHHPELVVRSPHLCALFAEDEENMTKSKEEFAPLHEFFENEVIPDVEAAISRIENEAEEAYNKALKKISRLKKALWFLLGFLIFSCTALVLLLYEPFYSWNGLSPDDQMKVLDSVVNYKGLDINLKHLMTNDSEGFQFLNSSQIKNALNGDLNSLNHALSTNLDQYIYLSPSNLTEDFWNKTLDSNINFQGQNVLLSNIASYTSALVKLSSNQIKSLLSNHSINVGSRIEFTSFYIPRKFKESESSQKESKGVFEHAKSSKVFLLADKPGSGKSISFQALRKEFKEQNPEYWVELIELKTFIEVFKNVEGESVDIIADQILKLKGLDRDFFVDRFENGKVILLWDGVDEIAPDHDDPFLSVAYDVFRKTANIQFISTRPQYAGKLSGRFQQNFHSLFEYSEDDRNKFIVGYLSSIKILNETNYTTVFKQVVSFIENISPNDSNSLRQDINNPLMLKMLIDIAIDKKLSADLDNIYKIFDKFMELKLGVLSRKGENQIRVALNSLRDTPIDEIHMIHALKYIFGESFDNFLNSTQIRTSSLWIVKKKETFTDDQLSSFGIINKFGNKTDFVHRTFAEFFVAKYLIENLYKVGGLRPHELSKQIALLHNIAYNIYVRKIIQEFILNFLKTQEWFDKRFDENVIEVFEHGLGNFENYFSIQEKAPMFNKFFEKDLRVMRTMVGIDNYTNVNNWLDEVLGISLGNKTSFIENNQLGLILMRSWQFEKMGNKVFAEFIKESTNVFDSFNASTLLKVSQLDSISDFLNTSLDFFTNEELKQIFLNSAHVVGSDFKNLNESLNFFDAFKMTLNQQEIKVALAKADINLETLFFKTLKIDNEALNDKILQNIEENLTDYEIVSLFTMPDKAHKTNLLMIAAQFQDFSFFTKLINFTRDHTTEAQFKTILLQRDAENDTILQYAHYFPYPDNFIFIGIIFEEIVAFEEIQNTFLYRESSKLPSFGSIFKSSSDDVLLNIAGFLRFIFERHDERLLELLSRRNENGDTIFSLYKDNKMYENKLNPFADIVNSILSSSENKEKIMNELYNTKIV